MRFLGDAFATEEIGVARGMESAKLLQTNCGIPSNATNFLRVHGSEDKHHLEAAAKAIGRYAEDNEQYAEIDYAVKMTYQYYGQLFHDVLELGDEWFFVFIPPAARR